ncbi:hypothetical protein [Erysipelothrix aquatica]|uniref:hypothetical protein n=1 Tax=Erysipelothrix aquatica TaxID=2683714 RepID=UPI00135A0984|nr:hypothetical protein [Erysipelothrix aquatica]
MTKKLDKQYHKTIARWKRWTGTRAINFNTLTRDTLVLMVHVHNLSDGVIADIFDVDQSEIVSLCRKWEIY